MKQKLLFLLFAVGAALYGQPSKVITTTFANPTGLACQAGTGVIYAATGGLFTCQSGVFAASGSSSGVAWGGITGTLSGQTDLGTALSLKADLTGATFTGNVSVENMLLNPGFPVGIPTAAQVTIASGGNKTPKWLSVDGATIFGGDSNALYQSRDHGVTWQLIKAGLAGSIYGVRQLDNGELLVSCYGDGITNAGTLQLSSGYPTSGARATWTQVLQASGYVTNYIQGQWGMSTYQNLVFVSEYGPNKTPPDNPKNVYMSTDYGKTYTVIFDLNVADGSAANGHIHGVAYDPWWDAIWVANGDTGPRALRVSFDRGATWTVVSTAVQFTGILPMPNCILLVTDGWTNGVHRIPRGPNKTVIAPVVAFALDNLSTLDYVGTMPFRLPGTDSPAILPFMVDAAANSGVILSTRDGYNFSTLWTDTITYSNMGPQFVVGPTNDGYYVGGMNDGRQTPYSIITIPAAPAESGGIQPALAMNIASRTLRLPPSYYVGSPANSVLASLRANASEYATPIYFSQPYTLTSIGVETTVAGSTGSVTRLGIRQNEGGLPGALLLDAGTIDTTVTPGFLETAISLAVQPGWYWLTATSQGAPTTAPTYRCNGITFGMGWSTALTASTGIAGYNNTGITGALAAGYSGGAISTAVPRVLVKVQ